MNTETSELTPPKGIASWKRWLFGVPWWGITMVAFCGGALAFGISDSPLIFGAKLLTGLFAIISVLLLVVAMLAFVPTVASLADRLLGLAKEVPRPRSSGLIKCGAIMFGLTIVVATANAMMLAIPAASASSWSAIPLVNHEELWIETPGNWELQNENPKYQQYYDAANDLTISVSVISKKDMAITSLEQLPKSTLTSLRESLENVQRVSQENKIRQGRTELRTEFTGVGANQLNLHYILKHVDLGDRWLEFQLFGFPSQTEKNSEKINRFLNSIHSPN